MQIPLYNLSNEFLWAEKTWEDIALIESKERYLVIMPVLPVYSIGKGLALNLAENCSLNILQKALDNLKGSMSFLTLPPVRFTHGVPGDGYAPLAFDAAYEMFLDIVGCVKRSGFHKLLLFSGAPSCDAFLDVMAMDIRQKLEMQSFLVIHKALDFELNEFSLTNTDSAAEKLSPILKEIDMHPPLPNGGKLGFKFPA